MKIRFVIKILSLLSILLICTGCTSVVNEIYNRSYVVSITAEDIQEGFSFAVEKVADAVVGVATYERSRALETFKKKAGGSGVVYECVASVNGTSQECDPEVNVDEYTYRVVTNRHVVKTSAYQTKYTVYLGNENITIEDVTLIGVSTIYDLAVIEFTSYKFIKPVEFANSNTIKSGIFSIAIGNPSGDQYYNSATIGIISHPKRYIPIDTDDDNINDYEACYIQHDASINPGNSGGALIDLKGNLLGINTFKLVDDDIDNMCFAIPSNTVIEQIKYIENNIINQKINLGLTVYDLDEIRNENYYLEVSLPDGVRSGAYINMITITSMMSVYFEVGDVIIKIGDEDIFRSEQFYCLLREWSINRSGQIQLYRNNELITIEERSE